MNIETLQKANELNRQIDALNIELRELEEGCCILVTKEGRVNIKTEREWATKTTPDWFTQKINEALYDYRTMLSNVRDNLAIELANL